MDDGWFSLIAITLVCSFFATVPSCALERYRSYALIVTTAMDLGYEEVQNIGIQGTHWVPTEDSSCR